MSDLSFCEMEMECEIVTDGENASDGIEVWADNEDTFLMTKCAKTSKLSAGCRLNLTSRKTVDKRAHINRDNWNEDLVAVLIAQVERHPLIWDVNSDGFRNKHLRNSAWMAVRTDGDLMHIDDAECRRKWQHLYNNNNKLANAYNNAVSSESAEKTPKWIHWAAMEFVRRNKASYKASPQSNSVCSSPFKPCNTGKAKRKKWPTPPSSTRTTAPMSKPPATAMLTTTAEAIAKFDAIIETIRESQQTNPYLATSKEWAVVLNQMSPIHAARAKLEIKAVLSKYFQLSVEAEKEAAEQQYGSVLEKSPIRKENYKRKIRQ